MRRDPARRAARAGVLGAPRPRPGDPTLVRGPRGPGTGGAALAAVLGVPRGPRPRPRIPSRGGAAGRDARLGGSAGSGEGGDAGALSRPAGRESDGDTLPLGRSHARRIRLLGFGADAPRRARSSTAAGRGRPGASLPAARSPGASTDREPGVFRAPEDPRNARRNGARTGALRACQRPGADQQCQSKQHIVRQRVTSSDPGRPAPATGPPRCRVAPPGNPR